MEQDLLVKDQRQVDKWEIAMALNLKGNHLMVVDKDLETVGERDKVFAILLGDVIVMPK
jgi:hypothetical protein